MSKRTTCTRSVRRAGRCRLVGLVLSVALLVALSGCGNRASDAPAGQSQRTSAVPSGQVGDSKLRWPAATDVAARVRAAGLDLGPMGMAAHYHPHLQVIIDGHSVLVPANIGVDPATGAMSAVHTHTDDGTIHIEAATEGDVFTLGQFFIEWGVTLTPTQVGGSKAGPGTKVTVTSNGEPVTGDPAQLRLEPDQEIVLRLP